MIEWLKRGREIYFIYHPLKDDKEKKIETGEGRNNGGGEMQ